jgi:hypothetical protein
VQAKDLEPLLAPLRREAVAELLGEADLELDADDHLVHHLGKKVPKGSLIVFGQHGSGSLVALWRAKPATPLAQCPVIWLDSEGDPVEALAPDFATFLTLLPFGLGQLYDLLRKAQKMRDKDFPGWEPDAIEADITDIREGLSMVAENLDEWRDAGLPPARDPLAICERAVALPFAAWWAGLPEA